MATMAILLRLLANRIGKGRPSRSSEITVVVLNTQDL